MPPWEAARTAGGSSAPPDDGSRDPGQAPWHFRRHGPGRWGRFPGGPLRRPREDRIVGGVAAAIAGRIGRDVTTVRIVLAVATVLTGGFVAAAYVVAWMLIPMAGTEHSLAGKAMADRRGLALVASFWCVLILVRILASAFRAGWLGSLIFPVAVAGAGLILIWRNAPEDEQAMIRHQVQPLLGLTTGSRRTGLILRLTVAVILLAGGIGALQSAHENVALLQPLAGVALLISAVVVLLGPWWLRIARDLMLERQARIRAEERADIAARVHDSVLQTLALIQRRADQPQQVVALARAQERELRSWLFDGRPPGSIDDQAMTLASGVRLIQQEVEAQHGIAVEVVMVGDCRWTTTWPRCWPPRRRRRSTPRSGPARASSRSSPRWSPPRCRCSSGTGAGASTRRRCRPTARAWPSRSAPGWPAMAGGRPSAARPAKALRCPCL